MILDRKNIWCIFLFRYWKYTYFLPRFSGYVYTINKKTSKIKFSSKFSCKLEIYVPNSHGIVLYALGTNYSCLNKFLKIDQNPRFLVDFPQKIRGSTFHKRSLDPLINLYLYLVKLFIIYYYCNTFQ